MKGKKKTEKKKRAKKTPALPGNPIRDGVEAHTRNNPQIEAAFADFINAEVIFGQDDPVEGQAEQSSGKPKKVAKPRYWDRCISSPGEFDTVHCGLCGTQCEVKRNLYGPTCYASKARLRSRLIEMFGTLDISLPREVQIFIEEHKDGYTGSVKGIDGVVVGQGNTEQAALLDTVSALKFHLDTMSGTLSTSAEGKDTFVSRLERLISGAIKCFHGRASAGW
jgi:hypothetical protein